MIPFSMFDAKDWPKTRTQPCDHCGAPEVITRSGRAKMRGSGKPRSPNGSVNKWYWVIGYAEHLTPCTCDGRVQEINQARRVMEQFNKAANG